MNRTLSSPLVWGRLPAAAQARAHLLESARRLAWPALLVAGFALRLGLLAAFPLREDEAIYGYWARHVPHDPFLLTVWPDKPPLYLWLLAGTFGLLGPSAEAARLLNIAASILTIPLVGMAAAKLWGSRAAGWGAGLVFALNPYAISFAPTAYTDPLLVLWGTAAVVAALAGQGFWAGVLLAAAVMTKQQGLLYLPLVTALLWLALPSARSRVGGMGKLVLGAGMVLLPILWWDSTRWAVAPSPWDLAQRTYSPLTMTDPAQWWPRLGEWSTWLWYLGGDGWVWGWMALAGAAACGWAWRRPALGAVLLWSGGFVALHVATTVQIWDRYLLPLAPALAWIVAGGVARVLPTSCPRPKATPPSNSPPGGGELTTCIREIGSRPLGRVPQANMKGGLGRGVPIFALAALISLIPPALDAAQGRLPIGGDHGDYRGLVEAIRWVEQDQAGPAVLYHQALGWHLRFYLYDALQARGAIPPRFDLRWFPSAAYLADNAAKQPYPPKYLIAPEWATPRDLALHLALRGLTLETRLHSGRFTVLEIVQPPRPVCDWCVSRAPWTSAPLPLQEAAP